MADNKKMSIKEIAEIAGMSTATVSRVLNQKGRYSKETEKKVLAIVDKYGYIINTAAKSLRSEQTKTIGLIIPDITNEFFSKISFYCEQFFHVNHYSLFVCSSRNNKDTEKNYLTEFVKKGVDGILAFSFLENVPKCLEISNIPIVTFDRIAVFNKNIPAVLTDEYSGAYKATELLIKKGCKHIVAIIPSVNNRDYSRSKGYQDAIENYKLEFNEPILIEISENSLSRSEAIFTNLLENDQKIDGVFCGSDRLALGALNACKKQDINVPKQIKIVGFDNSTYSQLPTPSITTVDRNTENLAKKACQLLLDIIEKKEKMASQRIYEPVHLIERESTK